METQLTVIENAKVAELVQKSGVELTKAEAHVASFAEKFKELAELSRPLADLDKENPTAEHAKIARDNRLKLVKVRTGSEAIKDERKKLLLAESNLIQSTHNLVKDACLLTESEYEEIEKHQERVEAQRRAELKAYRIELLLPFETDTTFLPLETMSNEDFQKLLSSEQEKFEAVKMLRAKLEAERIEAERLAEEARIAEIEAEKKRQAERDAENERLKKEAAEREKQLEAERAKAAKAAAEKQAEIDRVKKELEAKELAEEQERQRIIAEQEAKDAALKAAQLAPDKEKINALFIAIRDFNFPECETKEATQIIADVKEGFKIVLEGIKNKAKGLK